MLTVIAAYNNLVSSMHIPALACFTCGGGMIWGPLSRLAIDSSPQNMGEKTAIHSTLMGIFATLGVVIIYLIPTTSILFIAYIFVIAMLCSWVLYETI